MLKRSGVFAVLLVSLSVWIPTLGAQSLGGQRESLLIGPGDLLHVQVYDTPELEQHARVDDDGRATLLFLGQIVMVGMTPQEAGRTVASLMVEKAVMQHPQVVVTIDQYATQEVTVSGEVNKPGQYVIATPRSVLDVLSMAGGLNAMADRNIVIQSRGRDGQQTRYFVSNDPERQLRDDVKIRPGDAILVARTGLVYILGDVGRPGGYPLASNEARVTLLQALADAGSANKTAFVSGVKLMRKTGDGYTQVPVHVGRIEAGKEPDPPLVANDVIVVPFSYTKYFVLNGTSIAASVASAVVYTH